MIGVRRRRAALAAAETHEPREDGPLPHELPDQIWREITLYLEFWQLVLDGRTAAGAR
jgi:hypothetical protein